MNKNEILKQITKRLIPDVFDQISWKDVWDRKFESGVSFEWVTFAALVKVARTNGFKVVFPFTKYAGGNDFFVTRNEIPMSYGSLAGNSASNNERIKLRNEFFFSLLPKAVLLDKSGKTYSIFREGCPFHKISTGKKYKERPDIVVFDGNLIDGFPFLDEASDIITYKYEFNGQLIEGILRVANSPFITCLKRIPPKNIDFNAKCIFELSTNKTYKVASEQVDKYQELFSCDKKTSIALLTGNDLKLSEKTYFYIDFDKDENEIEKQLIAAVESLFVSIF